MSVGLLEKLNTTWSQTRFFGRLATSLPGFLPSGKWSSSRLLQKQASENGASLGVAFEDRRYTWAEVNAEANRWANFFLDLGISKGDSVNSLEMVLFGVVGLFCSQNPVLVIGIIVGLVP